MTIFIGIDPGSLKTGYGLIAFDGKKMDCLDFGTIVTARDTWEARLVSIFDAISELLDLYSPDQGSVEQIFLHQNPQSALKLGHARGVALLALAKGAVPIAEYTPRAVKLAVAGYGAAEKSQIQQMVRYLLGLKMQPAPDAADALAIAICHIQHQGRLAKLLKDDKK